MRNKLLLLIIAAFAFYGQVAAQHRPVRLWDATFGGTDAEVFGKMKPTSDGGYILCGGSASDSSGDKTQHRKGSAGLNDFWVVKTDSNGQKMWDKTYGGRFADVAGAVIQSADGGYLIGGYSETDTAGSGDKSSGGRGGLDYWVIKVSANGTRQWDATFGGTRDEHLTALLQTNDGGYLLGGYSESRKTGDKSQDTRDTNALRADYWIVKIDNAGNKQWDKTYGSNSNDIMHDMVMSANGGYLLVGESYSDAGFEKTSPLRGVSDYWVVKIDNAGNKQWDGTYGGSQLEQLKCAKQTPDGGYILGGSSRSGISFDKTDSTRGFDDSWLVKIDSAGLLKWAKGFGGDSQEGIEEIVLTSDGGYIFATSSSSNLSGDKTQPKMGNFDYWVVRTNASGQKVWDGRYGGSADEYFYSMTQDSDNGLVLAGTSSSSVSADKTGAQRGQLDYWMIKLLNNEIISTQVTDTACIGAYAGIHYDIRGRFTTGNQFVVLLSDSSGHFSAVDTVFNFEGGGHLTGVLNVLIPPSTPAGIHYRMLIFSTHPSDSFVTNYFVIRNCCATFATPVASNHTGELYGTNDCAGQKIYLEATAVAGATGYHWTGPNGFASNDRNPVIDSISAANTGTYTVYAYNLACTSASSSVTVTVWPLPPTPHAGNDGPYTAGDTVHLTCSDTASNYEWTGPAGFNSNMRNPEIANATSANTGIYRLRTVSAHSCYSLYDSTHVDVATLSAIEEMTGNALRIYPNPAKAGSTLLVELEHASAADCSVKIFDGLGREVLAGNDAKGEKININLPQLPAGTYFVQLLSGDRVLVKKLIVQ